MDFSSLTIQQKITGLLFVYFVVAFTAIASTLFLSGRLEGGAAAINDAGSERMRSYQIAFLLAQHLESPSEKLSTEIDQAIDAFEQTLDILKKGDPDRPLLLPKDEELYLSLLKIEQAWYQQKKPSVRAILQETDKEKSLQLLNQFHDELRTFVATIDNLVVMVETSQAQATRLLRSFQTGLVSMAFVGTIVLISLFMKMVISPIKRLKREWTKWVGGTLVFVFLLVVKMNWLI